MTDRNTITLDLDTGEWLHVHNAKGMGRDDAITGEQCAIVASSVLPGTSVEQVAQWYSEYLESDTAGLPFGVGTQVTHPLHSTPGIITKRVETDGELHTVWVRWHPLTPSEPYSPRELAQVTA